MTVSKKRKQIENKLNSLGMYLEQAYNKGKLVWYAVDKYNLKYKYVLSCGVKCDDWWTTLNVAHHELFTNQNIRVDNYND